MATPVKNCYLAINGKKYGPVSEQDIHNLYAQRKITGETKFTRAGMQEWIPLSKSGIIVSGTDDGVPPQPQSGKPVKYGLPVFINGILAVALGFIGWEYWGNTDVFGNYRSANKSYDLAVRAADAASTRLQLLIVFGGFLIVVGLILFFLKPKANNSVLNKILWFAPMLVIILFALVNYIPILGFDA